MQKKPPNQNPLNPHLLKGAKLTKKYELPIISQVTTPPPLKAIPFEKAKTTKDHKQYIHFYTHDKHFECIWNNYRMPIGYKITA